MGSINAMNPEVAKIRRTLRVMRASGIALIAAGFGVAVFGTAFGISRAFRRIEAMNSPTPADLAVSWRTSVIQYGGLGVILAAMGVAVFIYTIILRRRLDRLEFDLPPPSGPHESP